MTIETSSPGFILSPEIAGLHTEVERIQLESDSVILVDRFTMESVGNFFSNASHVISGWFKDKSEYIGDLRPSPAVVEALNSLSTKRLEALVIPTPVGFKGSYREYHKLLIAQRIDLIDHFEENVLAPLENLIGLYINRPSLMAELKLNEISKKFVFCDLDAMHRDRSKFFNNKNTDAALFFSLYRTTGEFIDLGEKINSTMHAVEKVDLQGIRNRIEALEEHLNVLTEYFGDKDNRYKLSGNVARDLSKLVLQVAEHAEHYAFLRYKTMEFGKSFRDGFDAIIKQI